MLDVLPKEKINVEYFKKKNDWAAYKPVEDFQLTAKHWAISLAQAMGEFDFRCCPDRRL